MSKFNGRPEWVPFQDHGLGWELISISGKWLGGLFVSTNGRVAARKACCNQDQVLPSLRDAARWIETTLQCEPCGQRVTSEALKAYGRPI